LHMKKITVNRGREGLTADEEIQTRGNNVST